MADHTIYALAHTNSQELSQYYFAEDGSAFNWSRLHPQPDQQQQGAVYCPDCSDQVQVSFAENRATCKCGCTFCARCGAVYAIDLDTSAVVQPEARARLDTRSNSVHKPTCSCGAVDRAAVAARWGPAAVASWPVGPQQQLILLHLLLDRGQQLIPFLSRNLLQQLQDNMANGSVEVLQWQHVLHAATSIQEQQQHATRQDQQLSGGDQQQQQEQHDASFEFVPTADAASTVTNARRGTSPTATAVAMEVEPAPAPAASFAAAALKKAAMAAACHADRMHTEQQEGLGPSVVLPADMRVERQQQVTASNSVLPAAVPLQQQWQQQLQCDSEINSALRLHADVDPHELGSDLEVQHMLDWAADVAQGDAALAVGDSSMSGHVMEMQAVPVGLMLAANGSQGQVQRHMPQKQQQQVQGVRQPELYAVQTNEQLSFEDLVPQQQQQHAMQEDQQDLQQQLVDWPEQTKQPATDSVSMPTSAKLLTGRGGRLQLVADADDGTRSADEDVADSRQATKIPQLSDFGLTADAPPAVADEPVPLLSSNTVNAQSTLQFW